jgi:prepilin-type N-terminal cleavage/methylation domain-containing protein
MKPSAKSGRAFTLIELLVVIALIALWQLYWHKDFQPAKRLGLP